MDAATVTLKQSFESFNLVQIINEPTRVTQASATLLDLIIVSHSAAVSNVGTNDVDFSGHEMVFCDYTLDICAQKPRFHKYRKVLLIIVLK